MSFPNLPHLELPERGEERRETCSRRTDCSNKGQVSGLLNNGAAVARPHVLASRGHLCGDHHLRDAAKALRAQMWALRLNGAFRCR